MLPISSPSRCGRGSKLGALPANRISNCSLLRVPSGRFDGHTITSLCKGHTHINKNLTNCTLNSVLFGNLAIRQRNKNTTKKQKYNIYV